MFAEQSNVTLILAPILVFLGAALGKLFDYFIARSKNTGTIKTTEAETLWNMNQAFLQDVLAQLKASKDEIAGLREQLEKINKDHKEQLDKWRTRVEQLEDEIFDLEQQLNRELIKNGSIRPAKSTGRNKPGSSDDSPDD